MNQYTGIYRRCELFYIRCELEQFGIMPLDSKILMFLRNNCCSQEDICSYFQVDKGRTAKALSELEEKGLLKRQVNDNNKRQKLVSLTASGEQLLGEIDQVFQKWDEICFEGFSEEERRIYQDFTRRIAENTTEYRKRQGGCIYGK